MKVSPSLDVILIKLLANPKDYAFIFYIYAIVDVFVLRSTVQPPWAQIRNVPALHTSVP